MRYLSTILLFILLIPNYGICQSDKGLLLISETATKTSVIERRVSLKIGSAPNIINSDKERNYLIQDNSIIQHGLGGGIHVTKYDKEGKIISETDYENQRYYNQKYLALYNQEIITTGVITDNTIHKRYYALRYINMRNGEEINIDISKISGLKETNLATYVSGLQITGDYLYVLISQKKNPLISIVKFNLLKSKEKPEQSIIINLTPNSTPKDNKIKKTEILWEPIEISADQSNIIISLSEKLEVYQPLKRNYVSSQTLSFITLNNNLQPLAFYAIYN